MRTPEYIKYKTHKGDASRRKDFRNRLSITRQGEGNPNHSSKKQKDMEIL